MTSTIAPVFTNGMTSRSSNSQAHETERLLEALQRLGEHIAVSSAGSATPSLVPAAISRLIGDEDRCQPRFYINYVEAILQVQKACIAHPDSVAVAEVWPLLMELAQLTYACLAKVRQELIDAVTLMIERVVQSEDSEYTRWARQTQLTLLTMVFNPNSDYMSDPSSDCLACLGMLDRAREISARNLENGGSKELLKSLTVICDTLVAAAAEVLQTTHSKHPLFDPQYWREKTVEADADA